MATLAIVSIRGAEGSEEEKGCLSIFMCCFSCLILLAAFLRMSSRGACPAPRRYSG